MFVLCVSLRLMAAPAGGVGALSPLPLPVHSRPRPAHIQHRSIRAPIPSNPIQSNDEVHMYGN